MKRFLIIFSLLVAGLTLQAQSAIFGSASASDSVLGVLTSTITLPVFLNQEYDYSYQVIPTSISGDSLHTAVALWQSNAYSQVWTEVTSARDTATAAAGCLIEGTNATGLFHRLIMTGISTDTSTISVNYVYKLDKQW